MYLTFRSGTPTIQQHDSTLQGSVNGTVPSASSNCTVAVYGTDDAAPLVAEAVHRLMRPVDGPEIRCGAAVRCVCLSRHRTPSSVCVTQQEHCLQQARAIVTCGSGHNRYGPAVTVSIVFWALQASYPGTTPAGRPAILWESGLRCSSSSNSHKSCHGFLAAGIAQLQ